MNKLCAICEKSIDGWYIRTADDAKDDLAGPFKSERQALAEATILELTIVHSTAANTGIRVGSMQPGSIFRINEYWYKLLRYDGRDAVAEVLGMKETKKLAIAEKITEVSVLCKR